MRNSATARLGVMAVLAIMLLVPLGWVRSIVSERASRRAEAVTEVSGTWGQADLRSQISGDFEGAAPITATNRLTVFTVEGSGIWYFRGRGRLEPFVRAGAGWMRQLTADEALAGDGTIANAGAGVKYWYFERDRGRLKRLGLRFEARAVGRFGGLELGTKDRLISPAVSVSARMPKPCAPI